MICYITLLLIPIYVYMGCKYIKNKKTIMIIPYVYLLVLAGFRNRIIGIDYNNYIAFFEDYIKTGKMQYGSGWK